MMKLEQAVKNIHVVDNAGNDMGNNRIHPFSRLLVTLCYILVVVSFHKYDFIGLASMILYILVQCIWYEISICSMLRRIWPIVLLTGMVGIANPLFDRSPYFAVGNIAITGGMISMATLLLKGMLCVMSSYLMVIHTGIRQLCYSLRILHVPIEIITILLLLHRYLVVLLKETERMQQAYKLRAPGQRGLHFKVWGSFVGLLLIRSIDRAEEIYESMQLRGFHGMFYGPIQYSNRTASILYVMIWGIVFLLLRIIPVFPLVGIVWNGVL